MTDPKIRYDIEAGIKGEADAKQLEGTLRSLGDTLEGELAQEATKAADALQNLGAKQEAIQTFNVLRRTTQQLGQELDTASAAVDRLGAELPQAATATAAFAAAEAKARAAVEGAKADLDEQRLALVKLRTEYTGGARRTDEYREANAQLLVTVRELRANLAEQRASLSAAAGATRAAQQAERALATEYDRSVASARKLSAEVGSKNAALEASRGTLRALGLETGQLALAERNLEQAIAQVRERVNGLAPAFAQQAAAANGAAQRQIADQRTLRDGVRSVGDELRRIQAIAAVALGGSFVGGLIKDVAETADGFKNLQARIRLATGEGQAFNSAMQGVTDVALRTNSALDETATLFVRLAKAGTESGLSAKAAQDQALALTETINQAIQLSGSSAESSKAALTQLIQGLQSGVLRGEEFNSVMEQAPRLAQALAQGLNLTTGELRKQAEQGVLTSATVIRALTSQSTAVASEFGKLPATVGRSLQNLQTQWQLYVGATDNGMASSANLARIIDGLAKNLDTLVSTLYAAGKAYAALKIGGLAIDAYRWATATLGATSAIAANTTATINNTVAHTANAAATRASAAGHAAAGAGAAAGAASAARAGLVWRATTSLMGPMGFAVAALAPEFVRFGETIGETAAKVAGYGKVMKEAEDRLRLQEEVLKSNAAQQRAMALAVQEARDKQFELTKAAVGTIAKFDEMRAKGDSAAEAISKIGRDFDLSTVPGIKDAGAVLDKLLADGKIAAGQFQDTWAQALKGEDLGLFETRARTAFAGATREAERMAAVLDQSAREAIRRTGLDFSQLSDGVGAASRSAINDTQAIINSLDRLKAQGVDTGTALAASLSKSIDTADSQKALDGIRGQIEQVRAQLGNKVADGFLQQAALKAEELRVKFEELKPGIQSAGEAMKFFGLQTQTALKTASTNSREAYDALKNSGQASADQLRQAFERVAKDAIAANKGIAPSWLITEDAILRAREATENFGRSTTETLRQAGDSWRAYGQIVRSEGSATPGVIGPNQEIKSVTGDTREQRLAGQNATDNRLMFELRDKLRAGTLTAEDAGSLRAVIAALKQNAQVNADADKKGSFISLEGRRDDAQWQAMGARFAQELAKLERPQSARSTKHEVQLTVPGGDAGSFNMESEADAQKLIGLLGRVKGRSS
ncbi:tape measure protein [Variovorax atrisoli]|uniref:tape measure protein n=1 Tax=Variovorax atrisoli TaxID=3394203 RepID=UPI00036B38A6|nr:tape measure protein [Variovorax paradoxus]